jgi:hypothetical protein
MHAVMPRDLHNIVTARHAISRTIDVGMINLFLILYPKRLG